MSVTGHCYLSESPHRLAGSTTNMMSVEISWQCLDEFTIPLLSKNQHYIAQRHVMGLFCVAVHRRQLDDADIYTKGRLHWDGVITREHWRSRIPKLDRFDQWA
jgi:hypothetical protein